MDFGEGFFSAPNGFEIPKSMKAQVATVRHKTTRIVSANLVLPISGNPPQILGAATIE
jgi:hypothetical protein